MGNRNEKRLARLANGLCRDCGTNPYLAAKTICQTCFDKRKVRQSNRASLLKHSGICIQCKAEAVKGKTLCQQCMDIVTDNARLRRKANKLSVVAMFGGKCLACGESDIRTLTIDHVNNDGNIECAGKKRRIRSPDFYAKILREKIERSDLQLLCFNCHAKKDLSPWWHKED